ncbi:uncharacterized protein [Macrobrachium rosenbergii]|uniref:uncharacterized protein n=1 Tax=Macrobrachium rosenbergii TaxID=79674 RepID=UPI0034D76908
MEEVLVNRENNDVKTTIVGVRRRVYCFGIVCMLMSLGQIALYTVMLTLSISEDYSDYQVAFGSSWMILLTAVYLALTARVLFLLFERRYEEAKGPEWLWWLATMVVVMFNIMLIVWFSLVSDVIPATICSVASFLYTLFFKFASKDIKRIGDNDPRAQTRKNQPPSRENSRPSSHVSTHSESSTKASEPLVPK